MILPDLRVDVSIQVKSVRAIALNESDRALKDQNEPQRRKDHKGEEK
jgi:hypothetical protein